MNLSTAFGSYLKAADLAGESMTLTIDNCDLEKVGTGDEAETKPVLHFVEDVKCLVLNKTNADVLIELFGTDTTAFKDKVIEAYPTTTTFAGKTVDCVRLKKPVDTPF
jgi:hypothetical protein